MSEPQPSDSVAKFHAVAQLLREAHHLGPEAQRELADLLDELGAALASDAVPPAEKAHLADSAAHLVRALHQQHDEGLWGRARHRLEQAIVAAEAQAPVAAGVARRLVDALANLGI